MRTQTPVAVRGDVFPAQLVVAPASAAEPASLTRYPQPDDPDGRKLLDKVRVVVGEFDVYVFQDSPTGPRLIFAESFEEGAYVPPQPMHMRRTRDANRPFHAFLTTKSGKTLAWARMGGCGCGSRLKTFDPFAVILAQRAAE